MCDPSLWPTPPSGSGQPKGAFGEQFDAKTKLKCPICLKKFKSLPAFNGHMRSHRGARVSPSLRQSVTLGWGSTVPPSPVLLSLFRCTSGRRVPSAGDRRDLTEPGLTDTRSRGPGGRRWSGPAPRSGDLSRRRRKADRGQGRSVHGDGRGLTGPQAPALDAPVPDRCGSTRGPLLSACRCAPQEPLCTSGDPVHVSRPLCTPGSPVLSEASSGEKPQLPPMLRPARQGSGLLGRVVMGSPGHPPVPLTPRVQLCRPHSTDDTNLTVTTGPGEQTMDIEPHINIGLSFQAEIPELQDVSTLAQDTHKATLVWKPWPELENQDLQEKVENLLNLCCSSAMPGGGTNSELALHSLFEAKGDVMVTLERLLLQKPFRLKSHPLATYHYAGSDKWTTREKNLFIHALAAYGKDFTFVQKMVKSKTVAQCVEFYYTWKKTMRLGQEDQTPLEEVIEDWMPPYEEGGTICFPPMWLHIREDVGCVFLPPVSKEEEDLEEEDEDPEENRKSLKEEDNKVPKFPEPLPVSTLPSSIVCEMPSCGTDYRCHITPFLPQVLSSWQALNDHAHVHRGTNQVTKTQGTIPSGKQKIICAQSGYGSVRSSPRHGAASSKTDSTTTFPCKECSKVFFKIKSRSAHMKTHRQQEDLRRQEARAGPPQVLPRLLPPDQLGLLEPSRNADAHLLPDDQDPAPL
ncbi:LOW QUALITY PROTEIN: transcriptional-regulating factor 1-like [Ctenodactylus gundi]